jgi:CDGSH-type Zn-finger protein
MDKAVVVQKSPMAVEVEEGKSYYWCSCGLSSKQPFCDGSHKETSFTPTKYDANVSGTKHFCACKATATQPLCDGAHKGLD